MMKYIKIYEEYLFEGKKEFLQGKYDKIEPDIFNKLIEADPTNGKYYEWILNRYTKSKNKKVYLEDLYKIKEYLEKFEILKRQHKIKETDIDKYSDYKDLFVKMKKIGGTGNISEDETYLIDDRFYIKNGEAEIFYEDIDYLIVITKTLKASKFYANNTEWCTRFPDSFKEYSEEDDLYIIIDKNLLNTENVNRRLQFHFKSKTFMDIDDIELKANIKSKFLDIFENKKNSYYLLYLKYDNIEQLYKILRVTLNGNMGFINQNGKPICDIKYDWVEQVCDDFLVSSLDSVISFFDNNGNKLFPDIPFSFFRLYNPFVIIQNGVTKIYVNKKGEKYSHTKELNSKLYDLQIGNKHILGDEDGISINNKKYDDITVCLYNEFCIVKMNGKYGFTNVIGEEICDLKYDSVLHFKKNGFAEVSINDHWFFIDEQGNEYDELPQ